MFVKMMPGSNVIRADDWTTNVAIIKRQEGETLVANIERLAEGQTSFKHATLSGGGRGGA